MKRIAFIVLALSMLAAPIAQAQLRQTGTDPQNSQQSDDQTADARASTAGDVRWSRGDSIPNWEDYVVANYQSLGLWRPAWNHEWIKVGDDYVLINKIYGTVVNVVSD